VEIIVLARGDRKRSPTTVTDLPARYFGRLAPALRKRIDIMDFSSVVPYSRFVTYEFSKMTVRRRIPHRQDESVM
jgi:hypothetical protein